MLELELGLGLGLGLGLAMPCRPVVETERRHNHSL